MDLEIKSSVKEVNSSQKNNDKEVVSERNKKTNKMLDAIISASTKTAENLKATEKKEEELFAHEISTTGAEDELEIAVNDKVITDIEVLKVKCRKVRMKLSKFSDNNLFKGLYKEILELSKVLSHYLLSIKNLKTEPLSEQIMCSEPQNTDATWTDNESILGSVTNSSNTENRSPTNNNTCNKKRCICFDREKGKARNHGIKHVFCNNFHANSNYSEIEKNSSRTLALHDTDSVHVYSISSCGRGDKSSARKISESVTTGKTTLKRKNINESPSKENKEKKRIRSLISRQMDLIHKHVSKVNDCVKDATFTNVSEKYAEVPKLQSTCDKTLNEKFNSEINTLKRMESFLVYLKERKRKASEENGKIWKRTRSVNHVDSNTVDAEQSEIFDSVSQKEMWKKLEAIEIKRQITDIEKGSATLRQLKHFNMGTGVNKSTSANTDGGFVNCDLAQDVRDEAYGEKFVGEINTLEDMESFLSFLRSKRVSANNKEKLVYNGNNVKVKNHGIDEYQGFKAAKVINDNESSISEDNGSHLNKSRSSLLTLNFDEQFSTSRSRESNNNYSFNKNMEERKKKNMDTIKFTPDLDKMERKKSSTEKAYKVRHTGTRRLCVYDNSLCLKVNENKILKKNAVLISKCMTSRSKTIATKSISKRADRNVSKAVNTGNKKISLEEKEHFLLELGAKELERTNATEVSTVVLNSEMNEDRFLELSRDKRKAKLMACVMVKPEKISKLLKDLKETKLAADSDGLYNKEYKKVLKKIMAETRTISMA